MIAFERRDPYLLANAWQSVFVGIPCVIICFCFVWSSIISIVVWCCYAAICVALTVCCIIVPHPRIFHLPFCIGNWAIKRAQSTVANHIYQTQHLPQHTETTKLVTTTSVYQ